jgi:tetratricopeptide (TPR) repeat protein
MSFASSNTSLLFLCRFLTAVITLVFLVTTAFSQPAKPAQYRTISITTEPGSIIWIDGVFYGTADTSGKLVIKTVAAGAHVVRIRANGFKELVKPITAAQKGELSVPLTKTNDGAELAYQTAGDLMGRDRQKAIEAYKKAIALRPKYPEAVLGLARAYSESGDAENAAKAIRDARRLRPVYAEVSTVEGRTFKDGGEEAKAITSFNRAIKEGKGFQPEAYAGLGLLYKEKAENAGGGGDFDAESENYGTAAKYLTTAVKQLSGAPDAIVIYQLLGLVYERQKKYKEAIATYNEFLSMFPESGEASAVRSYIVQIEKQMKEPK